MTIQVYDANILAYAVTIVLVSHTYGPSGELVWTNAQ